MAFTRFTIAILAIGLTLTGCKIVKNAPEGEGEIAADSSGDAARTAIRIDDTFEAQLLPYVSENAISLAALEAALAAGLDEAGAEYGNRGAGQGAAWNFAVTGEGVIVDSKLDTRARWVGLDVDSDGESDAILQLGPVIKGTALRDIAPFYNFDDFRDQIEFAKLGRALNGEILNLFEVPEGELIGSTVRFTGVITLRSANGEQKITPTAVEISQ